MERTVDRIFVHHTAIPHNRSRFQFDEVNEYHRDKWDFKSSLGFYGGYTCLIEWDGTRRMYRAEGEETAAQKGHNKNVVAIALAGNFNEELPTKEQEESLATYLNELVEKYNVPYSRILPHRAVNETSCYGTLLPYDWAMKRAMSKKLNLLQKMLNALISFARSKGLISALLVSFIFGAPVVHARSFADASVTVSDDIMGDCRVDKNSLRFSALGCHDPVSDRIFIKKGLDPTVMLYVLIHELGHFMMFGVPESEVRAAFPGTESMSWPRLQEHAADQFILFMLGWNRDMETLRFFLSLFTR
ncbi:N-acetylmuramoyl-L-alanine amidase [Candidatus Microgenomates bacterium]|nr:N-acetylmuramoyl-L-alanine amidase [Candidatus Microgenomates bacterium]